MAPPNQLRTCPSRSSMFVQAALARAPHCVTPPGSRCLLFCCDVMCSAVLLLDRDHSFANVLLLDTVDCCVPVLLRELVPSWLTVAEIIESSKTVDKPRLLL